MTKKNKSIIIILMGVLLMLSAGCGKSSTTVAVDEAKTGTEIAVQENGEIHDWNDYKPTGVELPKKIHDKEYYKKKLSEKVGRPLTQGELDECEARALSSSIGYLQDRLIVFRIEICRWLGLRDINHISHQCLTL